MKSSQSEKLRQIKSKLIAMKNLGETVTRGLSGIVHVEYTSVVNTVNMQVGQDDFRVDGTFPVDRLLYRGGALYPWRAEHYMGESGTGHDIVVSALCDDNDVFNLAIDERTEVSPNAARYIDFLMAEKEREQREVSANGVAGS